MPRIHTSRFSMILKFGSICILIKYYDFPPKNFMKMAFHIIYIILNQRKYSLSSIHDSSPKDLLFIFCLTSAPSQCESLLYVLGTVLKKTESLNDDLTSYYFI
jgi:hypothetical protein